MQSILLIDLPFKDFSLIKYLKSLLFELVISISIRKSTVFPIYVLYPDCHKCIYPGNDPYKGLSESLVELNEVRLCEEEECNLVRMQAQAGMCIRALLSSHPTCKVAVITNCREKWTAGCLDFARTVMRICGSEERNEVKRVLQELLEECSGQMVVSGVVEMEGMEAEMRVKLTPAVGMGMVGSGKSGKVSLYVVDVLICDSIDFQLCFGTSWFGHSSDNQVAGLLQVLYSKGLCLLCTSAFSTDTGETRPWPSYYICLPSSVADGTFLLKQIAVSEHIRCIDRPAPISTPLQYDLSTWVLSRYPAKCYNPRNYSNSFFKYTTDQSLSGKPKVPITKQEGTGRVEPVSRPKLADIYEQASMKKPGRKSAGRSFPESF